MPYDVTIKRPTPCGMLMLKGDRIAQDRFSEVLGMDIPRISNTATVHDTYSVLWLGPAEWLLIVPESDEDRIASELSYDAADDWAVAIIVSDHYSIITIQGSETTEVLVQACGIASLWYRHTSSGIFDWSVLPLCVCPNNGDRAAA